MKLIKSNSWILKEITPDGFVFQHRKYKDDLLLLKRAKLVDVERNLVFFFDIEADVNVSVAYSSINRIEVGFSQLKDQLNNVVQLLVSLNLAWSTVCS